jgi:chemotaxis protein methyltransferase CheR
MPDSKNLPLESLLKKINTKYGYDFRGYSRASLNRRINDFMAKEYIEDLYELYLQIENDSTIFNRLLNLG